VDPAKSGLNLYAYCKANPLNLVDPYGLCSVDNSTITDAFLHGLGQGGLNLLQVLQDVAIGTANLAIAGSNPIMMSDFIINGPMISSPDWAQGDQSDFEYAWSKGLINIGLALLPVGALKGVPGNPNAENIVGYFGFDSNGVRYVGITARPSIRFGEHLNAIGTGRECLRYRVVKGADFNTRLNARIWEQRMINKFALGKNGGTLLNKINSIARKYWKLYGIEY
jgi:hypothetical protein